MRTLVAAMAGFVLLGLAGAVAANVVEVTTSLSLADVSDEAQLTQRLRSAVDGVLEGTISFTPTVVVVTSALVLGERLYIRLLIMDEAGTRAMGELQDTLTGPRETPSHAERPWL